MIVMFVDYMIGHTWGMPGKIRLGDQEKTKPVKAEPSENGIPPKKAFGRVVSEGIAEVLYDPGRFPAP